MHYGVYIQVCIYREYSWVIVVSRSAHITKQNRMQRNTDTNECRGRQGCMDMSWGCRPRLLLSMIDYRSIGLGLSLLQRLITAPMKGDTQHRERVSEWERLREREREIQTEGWWGWVSPGTVRYQCDLSDATHSPGLGRQAALEAINVLLE